MELTANNSLCLSNAHPSHTNRTSMCSGIWTQSTGTLQSSLLRFVASCLAEKWGIDTPRNYGINKSTIFKHSFFSHFQSFPDICKPLLYTYSKVCPMEGKKIPPLVSFVPPLTITRAQNLSNTSLVFLVLLHQRTSFLAFHSTRDTDWFCKC